MDRCDFYKFEKFAGTLPNLRQQRAKEGIQLRRKQRDDTLTLRRCSAASNHSWRSYSSASTSSSSSSSSSSCGGRRGSKKNDKSSSKVFYELSPQKLAEFAARLHSGNLEAEFCATKELRCLLMPESTPSLPISVVLKSPYILRGLVQILEQRHNCPELQVEAAWALTNLATGTQEESIVIIEAGGAAALLNCVRASANVDVRTQALWALSNLAEDSEELQAFLVQPDNGLVPFLIECISTSKDPALFASFDQVNQSLLSAVFVLYKLCTGQNKPTVATVLPVLPGLLTIVEQAAQRKLVENYEDVVREACWILAFLAEGSHREIEIMVNNETVSDVILLIERVTLSWCTLQCAGVLSMLNPLIRILSNIAASLDHHTQHVLDHKALKYVKFILDAAPAAVDASVTTDALCLLQSAMAGPQNQIQMCVSEPQLIATMLNIMQNGSYKLKNDTLWALSFAVQKGTVWQREFIINLGLMHVLSDLLEEASRISSDADFTTRILSVMETTLEHGAKQQKLAQASANAVVEMLRAYNSNKAADCLEMLPQHQNSDIAKRATALLEKYFGRSMPCDYDCDDEWG